ncbi:hypothetical protein L6164_030097 [Bauhinia variegata]|uniref:Uncharacterized protein n=1 Tax=Bauhinia variegata TaxID=167791 RepID=A0ACB9LCL2_BAUVA|nr:hypothetical protein L6164_030097 [Bauhinia variegata]
MASPTAIEFLARRLVQLNVTDIFCVGGVSSLGLVDFAAAEPPLKLVRCCNELNAGYAADGYARARGAAACLFTLNGVNLFHATNAIAGAYSADLPVICVALAPDSNDDAKSHIIRHDQPFGAPDFSEEYFNCFKNVTCNQVIIGDLKEVRQQIDTAIVSCVTESKPVYISIASSLLLVPHPTFFQQDEAIPFFLYPRISNRMAMEVALEATVQLLNKSLRPVMVAGPKLRPSKAQNAFTELAKACGYAVAVLPSAKGQAPEQNLNFIGTYWGVVSSRFCCEIVETADAILFAGPVHDDVTTVKYTLQFNKGKAIIVDAKQVSIPNGPTFGNIYMKDFLKALSTRLNFNTTAYDTYCQMNKVQDLMPTLQLEAEAKPLRVNVLFNYIQKMLSGEVAVIIESGDPWFRSQKLKLPRGCGYEIQMLYASLGWVLGATLGYAQAQPGKRVIACLGDGSFQMAPQEISRMIESGQNNIIIVINNRCYGTEAAIHDGPYNDIKNWDYSSYVNAIHNGRGKAWTSKVHSEKELAVAVEEAMGNKKDHLCFIEAIVDAHDISRELHVFGSRLASSNSSFSAQLKG